MWAIFKVLIEFVTNIASVLTFWFFGHHLSSQPGIEPKPAPALEGKKV